MWRLNFLTSKNDLKAGSPKHLRITHIFSVHWDSREKQTKLIPVESTQQIAFNDKQAFFGPRGSYENFLVF